MLSLARLLGPNNVINHCQDLDIPGSHVTQSQSAAVAREGSLAMQNRANRAEKAVLAENFLMR